jgi:hypothetical protein
VADWLGGQPTAIRTDDLTLARFQR